MRIGTNRNINISKLIKRVGVTVSHDKSQSAYMAIQHDIPIHIGLPDVDIEVNATVIYNNPDFAFGV